MIFYKYIKFEDTKLVIRKRKVEGQITQLPMEKDEKTNNYLQDYTEN